MRTRPRARARGRRGAPLPPTRAAGRPHTAARSHHCAAVARSPSTEAASQWRASSASCVSPAPSYVSIAHATCRCRAGSSAAPSVASTASRTSACTKRNSPGTPVGSIRPAATASSRSSRHARAARPVAVATSPAENVRPMTAPTRTASTQPSDRSARRRAIASRTDCGTVARSPPAARCRASSPTYKGLPPDASTTVSTTASAGGCDPTGPSSVGDAGAVQSGKLQPFCRRRPHDLVDDRREAGDLIGGMGSVRRSHEHRRAADAIGDVGQQAQ